MARVATALNTWHIKYCETRAMAERVLFDMRTAKNARPGGPFSHFWLALMFGVLNQVAAKLLSRLTILEAQPCWFLLQGTGAKLPESLGELFHTTADILQCASDEGLDKNFMLRRRIARLRGFHQRLIGFAERFEDAQQRLRSERSSEEAEQYR
jgi:hypothetical protein